MYKYALGTQKKDAGCKDDTFHIQENGKLAFSLETFHTKSSLWSMY